MDTVGQLHVIMGCMFSGKTTELMKRISETDQPKLIVNHAMDTRYGVNQVSSHNDVHIHAHSISSLMSITHSEAYRDAMHIFIDESQFFPDLKEFVLLAVDRHHKHVTLSGLDGDFKRNPIGQVFEVLPLADTVTKLYSTCAKCSGRALFSHRIQPHDTSLSNPKNAQLLVGTNLVYEPLCRAHYTVPALNTI